VGPAFFTSPPAPLHRWRGEEGNFSGEGISSLERKAIALSVYGEGGVRLPRDTKRLHPQFRILPDTYIKQVHISDMIILRDIKDIPEEPGLVGPKNALTQPGIYALG
jgi:hypothetical protein